MQTGPCIRCFVYVLMCLFCFTVQSQTIRFEDENGSVYLVDSMKKVPDRYRLSAERLPDDPTLALLGNRLRGPVLSQDGDAVVRHQYAYVYKDPVLIGFGFGFLFLWMVPLFFRSRMVRVSVLLFLLLTMLLLHTILIVPRIQSRMHAFGIVLTATIPRGGITQGPVLAYKLALSRAVVRPAGLKPWQIHLDVHHLADRAGRLVSP